MTIPGQIKKYVVATLVVAVLLMPGRAISGSVDMDHATSDAGWGLTTVVANLFYVPCKIAFALGGGVVGGVTYAVASVTADDHNAAEKVWVSSLGGDYVLTSDMVAGRQKIRFIGVSED